MSGSLPCAAITVVRVRFLIVAAIGAYENPGFTFFDLDAVQGGVDCLTKFANFRFHKTR